MPLLRSSLLTPDYQGSEKKYQNVTKEMKKFDTQRCLHTPLLLSIPYAYCEGAHPWEGMGYKCFKSSVLKN